MPSAWPRELGVPVVETVGVKTAGVRALIKVLDSAVMPPSARPGSGCGDRSSAADIEHDQTRGAQDSWAWSAATGSTG